VVQSKATGDRYSPNSRDSDSQVWVQIVGALFIIGYNIFMTTVIMMFIKYALRIPLRMSDDKLAIGDETIHGEEAYSLYDAYPIGPGRTLLHGDNIRVPHHGDGELGIIQGTKAENSGTDEPGEKP
jgi:ammonium transporter, Amt family